MRTIKFEIKKAGPIKIRVTDILGRDMSEVINNYEIPGKYEYEVDDVSFLPSRYYCKIYDWSNPKEAQINGNLCNFLLQSVVFMIGEGLPILNE